MPVDVTLLFSMQSRAISVEKICTYMILGKDAGTHGKVLRGGRSGISRSSICQR